MDTTTRRPPLGERWRKHAQLGSQHLAYALLQALLRRGGDRGSLIVHDFIALEPARLRLPTRQPRGLQVRELGMEDLPQMTAALRPSSGLSYAERLARGHRAVGAFLPAAAAGAAPRLVAFMWVAIGPALLPASIGCQWQVSSSMAWIYDLYSTPEVLGVMPQLYHYLVLHPPAPALRHWVGDIYYDNHRSHLAHRSLGFERRATIWSFRLGPWRAHISHSRPEGRWRWHRAGAAIPMPHMLAAEAGTQSPEADSAASTADSPLRLQCACGREGVRSAERWVCLGCGRQLGVLRGGVAEVGTATPYWGELRQPEMQQLLAQAEARGWRAAAAELLPSSLYAYVSSPARAAFHELLPLGADARLLSVGAGWGGIAAELARSYHVVALEGVAERARFIALRQQQDRLPRLTVVRADIHTAPLVPGQFDAIIVNGVLEWSALLNHSASPGLIQEAFLLRLRELLRPGGLIYVGIENRFGLAMLRGAHDHSGLSYTSLLPRPLARWVCTRQARRGADVFTGYRTYTYSYGGYQRLFQRVGLQVRHSWMSSYGYNEPTKLVPFDTAAIRFTTRRRRRWHAHAVRQAAARAWVWRRLASDFVFVLQARDQSARGLSRTMRGAARG